MSDIFAALAAQARQAEENPTGYVNPLQRMREAEARNAAIMAERKQQMAQFALAERAALEPSPPIKTALDTVQDVGVSALASTVGLWQMGVGLADLGIAAGQAAYAGVTGEPMGKTGVLGNWLENSTPVRLKEAAAAINDMHSDAYKYQLEQFQKLPGVSQDNTASENLSNFGDMLGYLAANPTIPIGTTVESAPQMFAGGLLGRGLTALAPRVFGTALTGEAAVAAAAAEASLVKAGLKASVVGEGLTMAGAQQESIRSQTQDGFTTGQQSGLAAVTGGAGGLIAAASGGLGRRIGLEDADMLLMGNSNAASKLPGVVRYPGTMLKEGFIEEAPQTALETVNENAALDRPLDYQLGQNTAQGVAAGVLTAGVLQVPESGKDMLGEAASAAGKITKTNDFGKLSDINDKAYDPTRAVMVRKADLSSSDEAVRTAAQQDINTMTTTLAEARDNLQQRQDTLARTMESLVELHDLVSGIDPQTTDPDEQTLLQDAQAQLSTLPQLMAAAKDTKKQLDAYDKHLDNLERVQSSWVSTQVPAAPTPAEAAQIVATASGQSAAPQATSTATNNAAASPNGNLFTDDSFLPLSVLAEEDRSPAAELMMALKSGTSLDAAIDYIVARKAQMSPGIDLEDYRRVIRDVADLIILPSVMREYEAQLSGQQPSAGQNTASATGSAEAAKDAVNEMLMYPASYTVEDLSTVLSSGFDMLEPEQVSMLRILSEARQAQNLSKNPDAVSSQVLNGDKQERYKGIQEYVSIYAKAMRTGNTALADMQVRKAVEWAKQYAQKAAAALEAYDQYEKTSEPQVIYRTKDGQWTYTKQGQLKEADTRPMGALIINGKSENLINSIYQDAIVVGQAATALQQLDAKNRGAIAPAATPAVQPQPSAPQPTAPPVAAAAAPAPAAPASTPAPAAPKQPAAQPAQQTPSSTTAPAATAPTSTPAPRASTQTPAQPAAPAREEPKKASVPAAEPEDLINSEPTPDPIESPEEPADPVEQPQQEPAEEAQTAQPEEEAADSEQSPKQPTLSGKVVKAIYNLQALNDYFIFDDLPESWGTVGSASPQEVLRDLPQLEQELAAMPEDNQTANEMRRLIQEIRKAQAEQNEAQEEDQAAEQPAKSAAQEPTPLQEGGGLAVLKVNDEQRAKERLKPITSQDAGAISRLKTKLKKADVTLEDAIEALQNDFDKSKSEQAKSSIKAAIEIAREYESVEEAKRGLAARQRSERRNQAKAHLVQTSSESQPLSYEEGFLTKNSLEALVAKVTFMIGREVTDGELELLKKLREFHEKMKGISGKIQVSKEFIQTNLINYFRSDIDALLSGSDVAPTPVAEFEDNLISAITLAAYSQIQRNSSKKVMKDSEINEILGRKAEAPVSNEERKFFSRPVLDKFAIINQLGSDIMKMLGLKLHKDAPAHLHDGFIKALGGTAFSMMEAAHVIKPSSWEDGWERAAIHAEGDLSVKLLQILANEYKRTNSVKTEVDQLVKQALQNINKGAQDPLLDFLDNPGESADNLKAKFNALPYYETNINDALGADLGAFSLKDGLFLTQLFGSKIGLGVPRTSPNTEVDSNISKSFAGMPTKQKEAILSAQQNAFVLRKDVVAAVRGMVGNTQLLRAFMKADPNAPELIDVSTVAPFEREGTREAHVNNMQEILKNLEFIDSLQSEDVRLFLDIWASANNRMYYDSSVLNPMSSKISRAMMAMEAFSTKVKVPPMGSDTASDTGPEGEHHYYRLWLKAVGLQAEGLYKWAGLKQKAEKSSEDEFVDAFHVMLQTDKRITAAVEAFNKLQKNQELTAGDTKALIDFATAADTGPMALMALGEISKMRAALEGKGTFVSQIMTDSDGINNGMAIARALYGLPIPEKGSIDYEVMAALGMYYTDSGISTSFEANKQYSDFYSIIANGVRGSLELFEEYVKATLKGAAKDATAEDKAAAKTSQTLAKAFAKKLIESYVLTKNPTEEQVSNAADRLLRDTARVIQAGIPLQSRDTAKIWTIPFIYGAGYRSLKRALGTGFTERVQQDIFKKALKLHASNLSEDEKIALKSTLETQRDSLGKLIYGRDIPDSFMPLTDKLLDWQLTADEQRALVAAVSGSIGLFYQDSTEKVAAQHSVIRQINLSKIEASGEMFRFLHKWTRIAAKQQMLKEAEGREDSGIFSYDGIWNDLTVRQEKILARNLMRYSPFQRSAMSTSESSWKAGLQNGISMFEQSKDTLSLAEQEPVLLDVTTIKRDGTVSEPGSVGTTRIGFGPKQMDSVSILGGSRQIQGTDAAVTTEVIGAMPALNMHDSNGTGLSRAEEMAKLQNQTFVDTVLNYMPGIETIESLSRVFEGIVTLLPLLHKTAVDMDKLSEFLGELKNIGFIFPGDPGSFRNGFELAGGTPEAALLEADSNKLENFKVLGHVHQYAGEYGEWANPLHVNTSLLSEEARKEAEANKTAFEEKLAALKEDLVQRTTKLVGKNIRLLGKLEEFTRILEAQAIPKKGVEDAVPFLATDKEIEELLNSLTKGVQLDSAVGTLLEDKLKTGKDQTVSYTDLLDVLVEQEDLLPVTIRPAYDILNAVRERFPRGLKVQLVSKDKMEKLYKGDYRGMYDARENKVFLVPQKSSDVFVELVVHELLHAVSQHTVSLAEKGKLDARGMVAYRRLEKLFATYKSMGKSVEAVNNIHEFIAYGLSNTYVINQLAGKLVSRNGRDKKGFAVLTRIKSSVASIIKALQNFFGFNQDTADEITAQAALAYDVLDMLTHPQMVRDSHFSTYSDRILGAAKPYAVTLNGVTYSAKKQTYVIAEGSNLENFGKLVATNLTRLHKQIMQDGTQDADGNPSGIFAFYNKSARQSVNVQVTFKVSGDELTVLIDQAPDYLTSRSRNSLLWQKAMQPAPQKATEAEKSSPLPMVSQPNGNTSSLEMFEGLEAGQTSSDFQKHLSDVMDQMLYSFGVHEQDVQDQINNMVPPQHTAAVAAGFVLSDREAYAVTALEIVLEGVFNLNQHAATLAAMRKGFEAALKTFTVESFHDGDWNQATRAEKALAQSRYDYLFNLKSTGGKHNYLSRFLALALGSEQMNQMLDITLPKEAPSKKSWGARLIAAYQSLLDWVLNRNAGIRPSMGINTQLQKLTEKLIQLEVQKRNSNATRVDRVFSVLDDAGAWVGKKVSGAIGKTAKALPDNKVTKPLKQVVDILQSDRLDALQEAITGLRNEMFPNTPAGTGKMLLNELMKPGALLRELEKYTRQTTLLAQTRDTLKAAAMRSLYSKFEKSDVVLDDQVKSAVTYGLLRTDVQSLVAHMPMADVLQMVTSQKARQARIQALEKQVLGYAHGAHKLMRAKDLAHYLNTNEGHMLLAKNAEVIARGIGTHYQKDTQENASPDEIAALDQLATLYALERFKHPGKTKLMRLVHSNPEALEFTLKLHQSLVSQGQRLFVDNPLSFRKGYLPDLSHPNRVVGIVTPGESGQVLGQGATNLELSGNVTQLQKEGWQVIGLLEQHPSDKGPQKVLLLHPDLGYQRYVSGTVDLLNPERMGVEVLDRTQREIIEANQARLAQSRSMEKMDYRSYAPETQPMGYIPAYDSEGYVMAYNYEMHASTRDVHLQRNNDFIELLGTLQGMNVYKQDVIQHNQEVAEMVWNTYKDNFHKDPKAFVALDPDSENPEIAQKWRMLPRSFREAATQLFGQDNTIWVHSDMLNPLLGFKKWSLTNVFDSKHPGAKFLAQTFKGLLGNDIAKARVARYEHAVQEIVGKMKNFIVIRSLSVLYNNILANTVVLLIKCKGNPLHVFKDMGTALVHSTQYMRDFAEAARLRTEIRSGNDTAENVSKLVIVEDRLARNPLKDFLQEGMLSSIVEDIEISNNTLQYRSDFQEKVHTSLDKLPQGLRNIIEMIMVSPGTKPHQFLATMTQLSDFVAKYALYKSEMRAGAKHEDAVQTASDTFINYDIPTSPALQYANDMGLVMFTKFAIRIQHVLLDIARNNTGKMLIYTSLMAALTDAPSAMDPSWVNRIGSNPLEASVFGFPGAFGDILPINLVMGMIF